jgi:hypothetical protein
MDNLKMIMQDKFAFIALMNNSSFNYLYFGKVLDNVRQRLRINYCPTFLFNQFLEK